MYKCSTCKKEFPLTREYFYRDKSRKTGFDSRCKKCKREYDAKLHEMYKDKRNEKSRKYYQENKEQFKTYRKKYYQNNKEKSKEKNYKWREENPEKVKAITQRYLKKRKNMIERYMEIKKVMKAWKGKTCHRIKECQEKGEHDEECPSKCFEKDSDYLKCIHAIMFPN